MDIRVRKAKQADAKTLLDIKREGSMVLLARLGHAVEEIAAWQSRFVTIEYMRQHLRAPHALYLVEEGGEPVGMAGLTLKDDGDDSFCYFGNLYCLKSGRGLGSRLMEHRLGVVEAFNVDYLECRVHEKNERAQEFVQHYGYVKHGSYHEERLGITNLIYRKKMD